MSIEKDVLSWDGKSATDIESIYNRHRDDVVFKTKLLALLENRALQKGATWVLKRYLEDNGRLEMKEVTTIFKLLSSLEHWESKLHVLQSIPYITIGKADRSHVEAFLRVCLTEQNKFVRAWAYNGFYEISLQYNEYREETRQFFDMAMRDEAPSVKARIRNIIKKDKQGVFIN